MKGGWLCARAAAHVEVTGEAFGDGKRRLRGGPHRVAAGDDTHREAHEAMRGRWKRPISGLGWYRDVKREFASLPDDA